MSGRVAVDTGTGAHIFKGDPRLAHTDLDSWYSSILEGQTGKTEKRPYLYGSDAGFCARRNTLLEHNVWLEPLVNSAGNAYMSIGSALENMVAEALMRKGALLVQNMRLTPLKEAKVSGKMDFLIFDNEGELALVECKSCGELPDSPKPGHYIQAQTYAAISGIDKVHLFYISRNIRWNTPLQFRTFQVDTSAEALFERFRIIALSRAASDAQKLPQVPAHFRKHTECHYCEFRDYFCYAPRPGRGKGMPIIPYPLQEMEADELIAMDLAAQELARTMAFSRAERFNATLDELVAISDSFSAENKKRIRALPKRKEGGL